MNFDPIAIPDLAAEAIRFAVAAVLCVGVFTIGLYFVLRWWVGK